MNISVFCASSHPHDKKISEAANELGHRIALGGHTLLYGGSNLGLMGTVSGAALESGGTVIAVIPTFFSEEIITSQKVSETVRVKSMAERKEYLIAHSDAFIALPGGIGTLDEVLEVMVHNQLGPLRDSSHCDKLVILYNPDGFWNPFLQQIDLMGEHGFFRSGRRPNVMAFSSIEEIMQTL
ncbi:MAG: TIGR00730 family Rossman fold protein [Bacteroidales bacterium]|nr:TIGR00730 family Rossman fold protein [Bacteroidales bacterium]